MTDPDPKQEQNHQEQAHQDDAEEDVKLTDTQQLVEDLSIVTKLAMQLPSFISIDVDKTRTRKNGNIIVVELSKSLEDPDGKPVNTARDKDALLEMCRKLMLGTIGIEVVIDIVE